MPKLFVDNCASPEYPIFDCSPNNAPAGSVPNISVELPSGVPLKAKTPCAFDSHPHAIVCRVCRTKKRIGNNELINSGISDSPGTHAARADDGRVSVFDGFDFLLHLLFLLLLLGLLSLRWLRGLLLAVVELAAVEVAALAEAASAVAAAGFLLRFLVIRIHEEACLAVRTEEHQS